MRGVSLNNKRCTISILLDKSWCDHTNDVMIMMTCSVSSEYTDDADAAENGPFKVVRYEGYRKRSIDCIHLAETGAFPIAVSVSEFL